MQSKAVQIDQVGGPEELKYRNIIIDSPTKGQVLIKHEAIGLNYIDIMQRNGNHPLAFKNFPVTLGMEAAGIIEAIGKDVKGFSVGDKVSHCMVIGAYSEKMLINANRLILLDENTSLDIAAASTLQGLTAQYLLHESWHLKSNQTVLIHAAAGGVGLILCQWAKYIGAKVIGTVGTEEKSDLALKYGCDHTILYSKEDFSTKVKDITENKGVDVVYDAIGKDTFNKGLSCLAEKGRIVCYGFASGPIQPVDISVLRPFSQSIATGGLMTYTKNPIERQKNSEQLFDLINKGVLKININQKYSLQDATIAHRDLSGRKTTGSSILIP
ncbi:MAG: quinone oxidoreductase [Pelagibacterales bacterium]|jgi:NADPH:quinone reductase|nr:quinone oxidoreductase [Pelagibacterales bacterium]